MAPIPFVGEGVTGRVPMRAQSMATQFASVQEASERSTLSGTSGKHPSEVADLEDLWNDDGVLLEAARDGDEVSIETLLHRHRGLARAKGMSFFLPGATEEDLFQEAMIGLYKAVRAYDPSSDVPFRAFARLCIGRHLNTVVKNATRGKHQLLNSAISLDRATTSASRSDQTMAEELLDPWVRDPGDVLAAAERLERVRSLLLRELTELESQVVAKLLEGQSYQEIADSVGGHVKAVDNAIQRTRRKLRRHFEQEEG